MADREIAVRGFSPIYEEELQRKDGSRVPVIGGRALMGGDEDYGIGYVLDISDLKKVESEKASLHLQLLQSEKMNALGQLAGGVAHDFNNLLNVIIGYCTLAQNTADDPDLVRQNTDRAISAAIDATGLVRQLLAFGRKQVLHSNAVELNVLIESQCQMLQRLVGENVRIHFTPGDAVWVMVDAVQLQQVLMNLVINARDAMEQGGDVTISTASRSLNEPTADLPPGEYAVVRVSDTGKGMEPGILERIFEPFFTTKEAHGGTGLGLSTTYGIIRQSNGDISVDSVPGRGTTFTILLPKVEQAAASSAPHQQGTEHPVSSETILLVEDSADLRGLFATVLERSGFRVLQAGSGLDAIRVAQEHLGRIDLIISDVAMPKLSGPDGVTQVLKKRPGAKVIFISGDARSTPVEPKATMIEKPVTPEALVETVRHTLAA
jgi:two-component system cell cycle sensor histidine kinase/response regulator CckA